MSAAKRQANVVVVGASRGIGLELAKQFHAKYPAKGELVVTMRKPNPDLLPSDIVVDALDITSQDSIHAFSQAFDSINTLVINAAVGNPDNILETNNDLLRWYLESNVVGIHAVVQSLIPALLAGSSPKRLVYISSTSASMERQIGAKAGLQGPYSVSKAAGNMLMVQYYNALRAHNVAVGLIHPGWVATDMGNTAGDGGMPVEKSVKGIVEVVESKLNFQNSPLFVDWQGERLPW